MKRSRIPRRAHVEQHFTATETVRDIVIGTSDGLTVPFALAAGISGAIAVSHIIVTAGVAELAAGGISMGLGGYLAARTDFEHYDSERAREFSEVREIPMEEANEVSKVFLEYGLSEAEARSKESSPGYGGCVAPYKRLRSAALLLPWRSRSRASSTSINAR